MGIFLVERKKKEKNERDDATFARMSFLRRSTQSIIANIRQITVKNVAQTARENVVKAATVGAGQQLLSQSQQQQQQSECHRAIVAHISIHRQMNTAMHLFGSKNAQFSLPAGAKCVFTSSSARMAKMFASFDLSSCSISFVGMMGDFAVWAITDMTTGETMFLIDDYDHSGFGTLTTEMLDSFRQSPTIVPNQPHE